MSVGNFRSFGELHDAVDAAIGKFKGIGELTVYDIAVRIGAFLRLEPEVVYLHAGTRAGASTLGLGRGATVLRIDELPAPFRRLRPREIEDCLCIYKSQLNEAKGHDVAVFDRYAGAGLAKHTAR